MISFDNYLTCSDHNDKLIYRSLFTINLQLFADSGEKTEKATDKKRRDARKKGQVFQSRELTASLTLVAMFFGIKLLGGYIYVEFEKLLKRVLLIYSQYEEINTQVIYIIGADLALTFVKTVVPIFLIGMLIIIAMQLAQVGFLFTFETLKPKLNKISPLSGFKRIFSLNSLVELVKSIVKIIIVSTIGYLYISGQADIVVRLMEMDILDSATYITTVTINLGIRMCLALVFLGVLDFIYQWWQYEKNLKMSKQEVKEEHKQQEGNPEVKSKIKQKQRQISMRRMMQEVPQADVVITNPTHFSVAIKYDAKKGKAPIVIAKGQDYIALRIREIARENSIEIVENKPLARTLYDTVDVGKAIPPDLYQAVAEILAYVYSLKNKKTG